jgi:magnesium chelatase subunit D
VEAAELRGFDALHAAALLLVDPAGLGGAVLRAQAGPVRDAWLATLRSLMPTSMPLVRLPLHASEDRLLGGIDLPATLAAGRPVAQHGLLAAADGGLVLAAMAERMAGSTASHLAAALDIGAVRTERDGISALTPTRLAVVALDEALDDDTPLSPALADRLGLWVDLTALSVRDLPAAEADMAADVLAARGRVAEVQVPDKIIDALCAAALALGVGSARAAWLALRLARASAALRDRPLADADDAALAARLVLAPRATKRPPSEEEPAEDTPEPPAPPPDPPEGDNEQDQPQDPLNGELQDQIVAAALAAIPAGLLARLASGERRRDRQSSVGKAGATSSSRLRGRPQGARRGAPHSGARLHLIETLRAAAPWQRLRRQLAGPGGPRVLVRPDDFHIRRFEQRRNTTTIFALDASGSSALYRLGEAKGAVELLLAECYVRRDQVAVITFRGAGAELLLPPTRSLVRAKRGLAGLPGGGGTPLAAGIEAAVALADRVRRGGATPVVVVLTDGRANVGLDGQGGRVQAAQDALAAARRLRALGGHTLLIDTSVRAEPAALALAVAMGARYLALPQADAATLSRAVNPGRG